MPIDQIESMTGFRVVSGLVSEPRVMWDMPARCWHHVP